MKILLTGATGFLGSAVARALLKNQYQVCALVLPGDPAPGLDGLPVELIAGDVLRPETLGPALAGCQGVVHAAGRVNLRACGRDAMHRLNVEGSRLVARAAKAAGVRRFIHISSVGVLGAHLVPRTVDEAHPAPDAARQKHHYHVSKLAAETAVAAELHGCVETVTILPTMLWGPGDWALSSTGYALRALQGKTIYYTTRGGTCILDVEDAAAGVAAALSRGRAGERYVLAGENVTIEAWCRLLVEAAGQPSPVKPVSLAAITALGLVAEGLGRLGLDIDFSLDLRRQTGNYWWADGSKAEKELGFKPAYTAREAIFRSVAWLRKNRL
ncbi:MAG: NAD-dependent epimerase/dehydratase family protein [Candidatus Firestonebacteria bacterium]|nr:NAD-dependent epimerase/dehydratase family protein [Candidatus Firestonebacteria bacterium]